MSRTTHPQRRRDSGVERFFGTAYGPASAAAFLYTRRFSTNLGLVKGGSGAVFLAQKFAADPRVRLSPSAQPPIGVERRGLC